MPDGTVKVTVTVSPCCVLPARFVTVWLHPLGVVTL